MSKHLVVCAAVMGIVLLATSLEAALIENRTTDTLLFFDNYEDVAAGSLPNNGSNPGNWTVLEGAGGTVRVRANPTPPGAAEGVQFLEIGRNGGGVEARSTITTQSTLGDLIHWESMIYVPSGQDVQDNVLAGLILEGGANRPRTHVLIVEDGGAAYIPASEVPTDTGLDFALDEWVKWQVDYEINSSTFDLTIGDQMVTLGAREPGSDIIGFNYFAGDGGTQVFFDAMAMATVPEPSAILLWCATGVVTLFIGVRLRRN